jgi:UDP-glucuronate decarboxylase
LKENRVILATSPRLLLAEDIDYITGSVNLEQFENKRILLTGGTGLVGSYLLECLCFGFDKLGIRPKEVRVFSGSLNFNHLANLKYFKYLELHQIPLIEIELMSGYDFLIHAASPASPTKYPAVEQLRRINAEVLKKLMSTGMQKAVFISAGEVYGPNTSSPINEEFVGRIDPKHPRSAYPIAKLEAEEVISELGEKYLVETNSVRLFHTFGPGVNRNDGRSFADFIWNAADNKIPKLRSKGQDIRTFLFLRDTVVGLLTILEKGKDKEKYNLGGSNPISILDFAKRVSFLAGLKSEIEISHGENSYIHSPNHVIFPSVLKLENLGWKQKIDLDEMILRTLAWTRQNN